MNEPVHGCPKRDPGLILAISLLKRECDDTRYRPLAAACSECSHPAKSGASCAHLVRHMEAIRDHLRAMEEIILAEETPPT